MSEAVQIGVIVAGAARSDGFKGFSRRLCDDVAAILESMTDREWRFHINDATKLDSDGSRRGADFVAEATLRLAEASYDLMLVITDVPLVSVRQRVVSGLASPLTRMCILSSRQLRRADRRSELQLDDDQVRCNAAALCINLIGEVLGARSKIERTDRAPPFTMDPDAARETAETEAKQIALTASKVVEPEYRTTGLVTELWAHLRAIGAKPGLILRALVRNRALLLGLRLPGLAAAALAPVFILVFTAEMWDAGLGMTNNTAIVYAVVSVAAATLYLTLAKRLFLPRKEGPVIPQHLAVANVVIFATILIGVIGLFAMLVMFSLVLELWVFPRGLISTWPTLNKPLVQLTDVLRLAVFISTVGVSTGALAAGLQRRDVIRECAFFETAA